jgi:hypothetical protein
MKRYAKWRETLRPKMTTDPDRKLPAIAADAANPPDSDIISTILHPDRQPRRNEYDWRGQLPIAARREWSALPLGAKLAFFIAAFGAGDRADFDRPLVWYGP